MPFVPPSTHRYLSWQLIADIFQVIHFEQVLRDSESIAGEVARLLGLDVDASQLVAPYIANKEERIPGFNKGVSGRGKGILEHFEGLEIRNDIERFAAEVENHRKH